MRMMQDLAKDLIEKAPPRVVAALSVPCIWAFPRFDRIEKCAIEKDQCGRGAVEALPIPRQAGTRTPGERPFFCAPITNKLKFHLQSAPVPELISVGFTQCIFLTD